MYRVLCVAHGCVKEVYCRCRKVGCLLLSPPQHSLPIYQPTELLTASNLKSTHAEQQNPAPSVPCVRALPQQLSRFASHRGPSSLHCLAAMQCTCARTRLWPQTRFSQSYGTGRSRAIVVPRAQSSSQPSTAKSSSTNGKRGSACRGRDG